jgi:hypothetical protein
MLRYELGFSGISMAVLARFETTSVDTALVVIEISVCEVMRSDDLADRPMHVMSGMIEHPPGLWR